MSHLLFPRTFRFRFFGILLAASTIVLLFSSAIRMTNNAAFHLSVTRHNIQLAGRHLNYQATAGYLTIKDEAENPFANIFYTAYDLESGHPADRPITFVFNGGPGSAAIWLHMGAFGPVRASADKRGYSSNPNSWIGFTDLVFIDPIGTGYSKPADGIDERRFFGYHEDIRSIAQFIKLYLADHHRESSPKFLAGESYGAVRAVGLAAYLQDSLQVSLAGLTLISPALNYRLVTFRSGNDQPYAYYLPTYAMVAQSHHRLSAELEQLAPEQLMAKAATFSRGTYTNFLKSGQIISSQLIDRLSYFTGLDKTLLKLLNGRVTDSQFTKALLHTDHQVVGTFDGRATGNDLAADPSETAIRRVFTNAFRKYVGSQLAYENHLPYLATTAMGNWNYGAEAANGYLDVTSTLKRVMEQNPTLMVKVASGYYDLATPAATTDEVIRNLGLIPGLQQHISVDHYNGGHMIYLSTGANALFRAQSEQFYQQTLKTSTRS
ncbi:MAG: hypothetical protein ABIN91_05745 [Mucilaginibacter sp.]|uniref:S10 family peptidase n=1 Tax=Mucilaginibacter sp. TaxID=1882438 RepID=UPI0032670661